MIASPLHAPIKPGLGKEHKTAEKCPITSGIFWSFFIILPHTHPVDVWLINGLKIIFQLAWNMASLPLSGYSFHYELYL
jgi:hypothetical protein